MKSLTHQKVPTLDRKLAFLPAARRVRREMLLPLLESGRKIRPMNTQPTAYAHPEALVETEWVEKHLQDDGIRIVESNEDILLYDTGHIPGAVHIDWRADLQDPVIRDYIKPEKFAEAVQSQWHHPGDDLHFLRRQGELVGMLCALGLPFVRTRKRQDRERWP